MKIGYIRCDDHDEFYSEQRAALLNDGCERIFEDVGNEKLIELERMLDYARQDDRLLVHRLDRFGLHMKALMQLLDNVLHRGVHIKSIIDGIDTSCPEGKVLLKIFAVLNQCEQNAVCDNLSLPESNFTNVAHFAPKLDKNKMVDRNCGRPKGLSNEAKEKALTAASMYQDSKMSMRAIAEALDISTATLYSYLRHQNVI